MHATSTDSSPALHWCSPTTNPITHDLPVIRAGNDRQHPGRLTSHATRPGARRLPPAMHLAATKEPHPTVLHPCLPSIDATQLLLQNTFLLGLTPQAKLEKQTRTSYRTRTSSSPRSSTLDPPAYYVIPSSFSAGPTVCFLSSRVPPTNMKPVHWLLRATTRLLLLLLRHHLQATLPSVASVLRNPSMVCDFDDRSSSQHS